VVVDGVHPPPRLPAVKALRVKAVALEILAFEADLGCKLRVGGGAT
jgi:hypothetical protein